MLTKGCELPIQQHSAIPVGGATADTPFKKGAFFILINFNPF